MANTTTVKAIDANEVRQGAAVHFEKGNTTKSYLGEGHIGDIDQASIPAELIGDEGIIYYNAVS